MKHHKLLIGAAFAILIICAHALAAPADAAPRPYGRGSAYVHATEVAPYRFVNEIIKLSFDFERGIVYGSTTNVVTPKKDGLQSVSFDSIGLNYMAVTLNGAPASYHLDGRHLRVDLANPAKAGDTLEIAATYSARPARGLYFIRPDRAYPDMHPEIWTQGESEDNRRWFPTWDEPNEKTPSELIITVKHGWTVIANGVLKAQTDNPDGTTAYDWVESRPKSTYLIAFAAGPYVKFHSDALAPDGADIPVDYFVSPALAKWAPLCFSRTRDMLAYFQQLIGVPYPWEKYDQATIERFPYGGMENVSITLEEDRAVHPPSRELVEPCDGLISHELAHQWWGDDVTMRDWANTWINEGFAEYSNELWSEHHFGAAQFQYERYQAQHDYFDETKRYWRPIITYNYGSADDSFDGSGYGRPAQVLHMLRWMYGDRRFFGALHDYLTAYQYKNADTHEFFSAFEASVGDDLGWFQNEWFFRASYPHYVVSQHYDSKHRVLALDIKQKNHDGEPFRMPIDVAVYAGSTERTVRFIVDRTHQILTIGGVPAQPDMVLFDPNNNVLRKLDYGKTVKELGYQALHAPFVADRLWALDLLGNAGKTDHARAREFVRMAVKYDPFYGVRADALDAATSLDDASILDLALGDRDPRVVIAAGNAVQDLDHPNNPQLEAHLRSLAASPDELVAGAALRGLGATKTKDAYRILVAGLNRHSFNEPIPSGALDGLANYGDLRAIPLIAARTGYGIDESERRVAIAALAKLGKKKPALVESTLIALALRDPFSRARAAAARALGKLGQASSILALKRVVATDPEAFVQFDAWDAIADIRDAMKSAKLKQH